MLVDKTQRVYAESISNGVVYNLEMVQTEYATLMDVALELDDDATRVLIISVAGAPSGDITEQLARTWIDGHHELQALTSTTAKPAYVEASQALQEYAHDHREDY